MNYEFVAENGRLNPTSLEYFSNPYLEKTGRKLKSLNPTSLEYFSNDGNVDAAGTASVVLILLLWNTSRTQLKEFFKSQDFRLNPTSLEYFSNNKN